MAAPTATRPSRVSPSDRGWASAPTVSSVLEEEVDEYRRKYPEHFGAPGIGRIRYVDANGDGKINTGDRTWLGSDQPKS